MPRRAVESHADADSELRSAICIYLIAERREGATNRELARMTLGGQTPAEEVARVSKAVSQLVQEGEVDMKGERVSIPQNLTEWVVGRADGEPVSNRAPRNESLGPTASRRRAGPLRTVRGSVLPG
jgi:hypothetical protein